MSAQSGPSISSITDNRTSYANGTIPTNEKFEITFQLANLTATKFNWPYDQSPPNGITPSLGITVNVLFTPDNWQTTYTQPAFFYTEYQDEIRNSAEWFYPTSNASWKVRFSPHRTGAWKYRVTVRDAGGQTESGEYSFTVSNGTHPGFVRVAKNDTRYFEHENGTYFPGLGYNMNYDHIDWVNPILKNQTNFQIMGQNNIQLIRMWLSQWSIFGSGWNPWYSIRNDYDNYMPRNGFINYGLPGSADMPSSQLTLVYDEADGIQNNGSWFDACRFIGGFQAKAAVKPNTTYTVTIRYRATNITGPRTADLSNFPNRDNYGLVMKIQNPADGNWYNRDHPRDFFCWNYATNNADTGVRLTPYGKNSDTWTTLTGQWNSGTNNYLPLVYLTLENVYPGNTATGIPRAYAYIDTVEIRETSGRNILTKPSMEQLYYFMDRNAYAFDKVVELAHQNNIYLRPVILEKNEQIQNEIAADGAKSAFSNTNFYGNWETVTAVRWLQQTWWRYLQARWGYSPNIHSWELLNEGDPANSRHSTLADEFAKYMHQFVPNHHMVSTSNWHSYPSSFWLDCPNCDFTDYHLYVDKATNSTLFYDSALATVNSSRSMYQTSVNNNFRKPIIRGETGFTDSGTEPGTNELPCRDRTGIWLHNFIWSGLNSTGVIESYWYENSHIYSTGTYDCDQNAATPAERITYDFRPQFKLYYAFVRDIPLNNGNYVDAGATTSDVKLRAWGQKDLTNQTAHLWISHADHTWKNVADGAVIPPITGTVSLNGFLPGQSYIVEWWNTYSGTVSKTETVTADATENIVLAVNGLVSDTAVKIHPLAIQPSITPSITRTPTPTTATVKLGDANGDNRVDGLDYVIWLNHYGTAAVGVSDGNFNGDSRVDGLDYVVWLNNYGR